MCPSTFNLSWIRAGAESAAKELVASAKELVSAEDLAVSAKELVSAEDLVISAKDLASAEDLVASAKDLAVSVEELAVSGGAAAPAKRARQGGLLASTPLPASAPRACELELAGTMPAMAAAASIATPALAIRGIDGLPRRRTARELASGPVSTGAR